MKKIVSAVLALMMVLSLSAMAFAADTFVPSITYKDAPVVIVAELVEDGKVIETVDLGCLLITPVAKAQEETRLPEEAKKTLLAVYESLNNGSMVIPENMLQKAGMEPKDAVIRELVDISWICEEVSPTHAEKLAQDNVQLRITFKLPGVNVGDAISVMTYKNNEWAPIAGVQVVEGETDAAEDDLVVCTFDHLCPVAFVVGPNGLPGTGVKMDPQLILWSAVLLVSAAALVVVVAKRRRIAE